MSPSGTKKLSLLRAFKVATVWLFRSFCFSETLLCSFVASMEISCSTHLLGISSCNHPWHDFQCAGMDCFLWNSYTFQAFAQNLVTLLSCTYTDWIGDASASGTRESTCTSGQLSSSLCSASSRCASLTSRTTSSRRSTWWRGRLATSSSPTTTPWTSGTSTRSTASSGTSPLTPGMTSSNQPRYIPLCLQIVISSKSLSGKRNRSC